jgi:protein-S-isoprenylcysteine O-methyltransferase Ste14
MTENNPTPNSSVSTLVNSAIKDGQTLVKQQIELAKAEVQESAKQAGASFGMFAAAGLLALLAFIFILVAAAYGLVKAGLEEWAAFLIVAAALALIALILGLVGRKRAKTIPQPERTKAQIEYTKAAFANRGSSGSA